MIAAWMIYASLFGALAGCAALAVDRAARALRISWLPSRWPWAASMCATLVVPLALAVRAAAPRAPSAIAAAHAPVTVVARGPSLALDVVSPSGASGATSVAASAASSAGRARHILAAIPATPTLDRVLLIAWALGVLIGLALFARSSIALARRRRHWMQTTVLDTPVLIAPDFGPALIGVIHPAIVLPEWALAAEHASLELMVRHESEHRRARDTLLLAACGCAAALFPWNLSAWWQLARLKLAVEIDCDARVLARSGDARTYAQVLVHAGERMMAASLLARAFSGRRSLLERRILAMSAGRAPRRLLPAMASIAAAALCVIIACSAPAPAPSPSVAAEPASLARTSVAQQQYYPRIQRIDTVDDAGVAWVRAQLSRYYPRILAGDTSIAFVTLYVNADGGAVGAAARSAADAALDTTGDTYLAAFLAGVDVPQADSARAAAERATFRADLDTMFASQIPTRSVLGSRVVLPREFSYDTIHGVSPDDPFLGADPHAFERDESFHLEPEMLPPRGVLVHVLTLLPGRGGPADFGHRVVLANMAHMPVAPPAPQPDIEHLGDLPGGGWAVTPELWATLAHKPVIIIDGAVRTFSEMMALSGHGDSIVRFQRLPAIAALQLTRDPAAANGALVVTTKGHERGRGAKFP